MKNKKLYVILSCLIMMAMIPITAGATNQLTITDSQTTNSIVADATDKSPTDPQTTNLVGWVIIRGFVFAWKEYGNQVHTRAIRVHYTSWGIGETTHGKIIGKEIIFKDRFAVDQLWSGPFLGLVRWIFGIYHGEIEIRGS